MALDVGGCFRSHAQRQVAWHNARLSQASESHICTYHHQESLTISTALEAVSIEYHAA